MRLADIQPGDVVLVDKKGRKFHALVTANTDGELTFEPLTRGVSWHHARAREVLVHWRRAGRTRPARRPDHAPEPIPEHTR